MMVVISLTVSACISVINNIFLNLDFPLNLKKTLNQIEYELIIFKNFEDCTIKITIKIR
jgi:hypothetical protein